MGCAIVAVASRVAHGDRIAISSPNQVRGRILVALYIFICALFPCMAVERIVSLSPAMTETLFAIGAGSEVVARTTECDYPPEALPVPAIGGFDGKSISVERIIALRPTLVCGAAGMHDWLEGTLRPLGITLYLSRATTVQGVMDEIGEVGKLTHHEQGAASVVKGMKDTLQLLQPSSVPVTAYWEVWDAPLMAAGGTSFMNDILTLAGGNNIFAAINIAYPTVSAEAVLAANPDVIIVSGDVYGGKARAVEALQKRSGWATLDAVKDGRVILVDAEAVRPGPRVARAVERLRGEIKEATDAV